MQNQKHSNNEAPVQETEKNLPENNQSAIATDGGQIHQSVGSSVDARAVSSIQVLNNLTVEAQILTSIGLVVGAVLGSVLTILGSLTAHFFIQSSRPPRSSSSESHDSESLFCPEGVFPTQEVISHRRIFYDAFPVSSVSAPSLAIGTLASYQYPQIIETPMVVYSEFVIDMPFQKFLNSGGQMKLKFSLFVDALTLPPSNTLFSSQSENAFDSWFLSNVVDRVNGLQIMNTDSEHHSWLKSTDTSSFSMNQATALMLSSMLPSSQGSDISPNIVATQMTPLSTDQPGKSVTEPSVAFSILLLCLISTLLFRNYPKNL